MSYDRRTFIKTGASATGAVFLSPINKLTMEDQPRETASAGYQLIILATPWGYPGSMDEFCAAIKKEGYDGAEIWWPGAGNPKAQQEMFDALKKYDLKVGFLFGAGQSEPKEHLATFKKELDAAL